MANLPAKVKHLPEALESLERTHSVPQQWWQHLPASATHILTPCCASPHLCQVCDTYIYLSQRYPDAFTDTDKATAVVGDAEVCAQAQHHPRTAPHAHAIACDNTITLRRCWYAQALIKDALERLSSSSNIRRKLQKKRQKAAKSEARRRRRQEVRARKAAAAAAASSKVLVVAET